MLVAVDIGNTNIVLGFLDESSKDGGYAIVGTYRITTKANHTSDEYGLLLNEFLHMSGFEADDVDDVIICSVVPKVMHSFRASIVKFLGLEPMVVGPGIRTGMNVRIDDPKSLGADILADCAGAYHVYGGPALVADFGTATTFTHVDSHGVIDSGIITTGIRAGAAALWGDTAQLPEVEITKPKTILGTNTRDCMQAGLYYTFLGGVERTIEQFRRELGDEPCTVIATGGLGRIFATDTDLIDVYDPDLIFKGMAYIYNRNSR